MSAFTPINLIEEDFSDDEIDTNKETQIEEALKCYNTALKLHSQGPLYFEEAEAAYEDLFSCELFRQPESLAAQKRQETYGSVEDAEDDSGIELDSEPDAGAPVISDSTRNSLPQILYLSYKNHGQFCLDRLRHRLDSLETELRTVDQRETASSIAKSALQGLEQQVEALNRDATDIELWRCTSRVAGFLGSRRLERFALESGMEDSLRPRISSAGILDLEEKLARGQLQNVLRSIEVQADATEPHQCKSRVEEALTASMDPYPFLPPISAREYEKDHSRQPGAITIRPSASTWLALGLSLKAELEKDGQSPLNHYKIELPEGDAALLSKQACVSEPGMISENESGPLNTSSNERYDSTSQTSLKDRPNPKEPEPDVQARTASQDKTTNDMIGKDSPQKKTNGAKRGTDTADLSDQPDSTRIRSKRIKARASMLNESIMAKDETPDGMTIEEQKAYLDNVAEADKILIEQFTSLLMQLEFKSPLIKKPEHDCVDFAQQGPLVALLQHWDPAKAKILLNGGRFKKSSWDNDFSHVEDNIQQSITPPSCNGSSRGGKERSSRQALQAFIDDLGRHSYSLEILCFHWLKSLLLSTQSCSFFTRGQDELWNVVLDITLRLIGCLFEILNLSPDDSVESYLQKTNLTRFIQAPLLAQSIFEINYHAALSRYEKIDVRAQEILQEHLDRWSRLSLHLLSSAMGNDTSGREFEVLVIRSLFVNTARDERFKLAREAHLIKCYEDLRFQIKSLQAEFYSCDGRISCLPLTSLPEISISSASNAIMRLKTKSTFSEIFGIASPVELINHLEPLLEASNDYSSSSYFTDKHSIYGEAVIYLKQASLAFKLQLWDKLRGACESLHLLPQVSYCNLQSLAVLVREVCDEQRLRSGADDHILACWHQLCTRLTAAVNTLTSSPVALDHVDYEHAHGISMWLADLLGSLSKFIHWDDQVRVGQSRLPESSASGVKLSTKIIEKLREAYIHAWLMLYLVVRDGLLQLKGKDSDHDAQLLSALKALHGSLGHRKYCAVGSRSAIRLLKDEMLRICTAQDLSSDLPQIIFDLYGLRISSDPGSITDHGSRGENINRSAALEIIDLVLVHAQRLNVKDLLKSDVKLAVERIQQVVRPPHHKDLDSDCQFNLRTMSELFNSTITHKSLILCLQGVEGPQAFSGRSESSTIVHKDWYYLLARMALTRMKQQKRTAPGPLDDLEQAEKFYSLDIAQNWSRWQSWYGLGQVYDSILDDQTTWTSDLLENDMKELIRLQKSAIQSYRKALTLAFDSKVTTSEDAELLVNLHVSLAARLYAATREPFSMLVFASTGTPRLHVDKTVVLPYDSSAKLEPYHVWSIASKLINRALQSRTNDWTLWYLLAKISWKMYNHEYESQSERRRTHHGTIIDALRRAIKYLPDRRDNRQSDKDPILEPHYKLLSIVHKLVSSNRCNAKIGAEYLLHTHYSSRCPAFDPSERWIWYAQRVLRVLLSADKANWHHRMVARSAQLAFDEDSDAWEEAKNELIPQVFTKAMTLQVWKPEHERAGRHFVYTTRYVEWFGEMLFRTDDKESLEALLRRTRKKTEDFVHHARAWQLLTSLYLKLLKSRAVKAMGRDVGDRIWEDFIRDFDAEMFETNANRMEAWYSTNHHGDVCIDILHDAIELRKLNGGLVQITAIEDLIAEIYCLIYAKHTGPLPAEELAATAEKERMRLDTILAEPTKEHSQVLENETEKRDNTAAEAIKPEVNIITRGEIIRRAENLSSKSQAASESNVSHQVKRPPKMQRNVSNTSKSPGIAVAIPLASAALTSTIELEEDDLYANDDADDESELGKVGEPKDQIDLDDIPKPFDSANHKSFPDSSCDLKSDPSLGPNEVHSGASDAGDDVEVIEIADESAEAEDDI